jgi:hypothetical protein
MAQDLSKTLPIERVKFKKATTPKLATPAGPRPKPAIKERRKVKVRGRRKTDNDADEMMGGAPDMDMDDK